MNILTKKTENLTSKINMLVKAHDQVNKENEKLKKNNLELNKRLEDQEKTIQTLKDKNKMVNIAQALKEGKKNPSEVKLKINEMVREIDKCIAMMNN